MFTARRSLRFALLSLWSVTVVACSGDSAPVTPPAAVPTTIQITPAAPSLTVAQAIQLSATVLDATGQSMPGQTVTWSTSDATKVSVTSSGLATGVASGSAVITARAGTVQATVTATVAGPTLTFEEGASASAVIGPSGGTISARAASGATYTLSVPRQALQDSVNITLTPVASFGQTTLHGAVRMRPSGLRFTLPATMTVDLPSAPANAADVVGFHFSDDGRTMTRHLVGITGKRLEFVVGHFSGVGAGGPDVRLVLLDSSGNPTQDAIDVIADIAASNVPALVTKFRDWYTQLVKPMLTAANSDSAAEAGIAEWSLWLGMMTTSPLAPFSGQIIAGLANEMTEARNLAATAIQLAIIRANARCVAQQDVLAAGSALGWQEVAEQMNIATVAFALDAQTVLQDLCIKARYSSVTLPDTLRPGRDATLRVQAGLSFGGGAVVHSPIAISVLEIATTPSGSTNDSTQKALSDGIGVVTRQVAPADTTPMTVTVRSCVNPDLGLALGTPLLDQVCADTTIGKTATNTLYFRDFASGPAGPEWSTTQVATSPSGQRFLGELGNGSTTLSLNSLPAHTQLVLEFDIYIIDSWNGNGGQGSASAPDIVEVSVVGGATIKRTTFSNKPSDPQAFPGDHPGAVNPAGAGALSKGALGYPPDNDHFGDSVYRLRLTFNHTSGIIALRFASQQTSGQNERWGVDNVRLSLAP